MASTVTVDETCHFLRVPVEVRLNIYRFLLLEPIRTSLDPTYHQKEFIAMMDSYQEQTAVSDERAFIDDSASIEDITILDESAFVDESAFQEYDINPSLGGAGSVMYNHLVADQSSPPWETHSATLAIDEERFQDKICVADFGRQLDDGDKIHRHPSILRTNHQVYDEASALLYSSLVIETGPGNVVLSDSWNGNVELDNKILHSFPTQLRAKPSIKRLEYKGSDLEGTMDPHVFAKFRRVSFNANFNFVNLEEERAVWPSFFVDDEFHTSREDEDDFAASLNGEGLNRVQISKITQHFVDVLVESPYISHLDVSLHVLVEAAFDIDSEDSETSEDSEDDEEDDVDDEDDEDDDTEKSRQQDADEEKKTRIANERATELVLEAGVLAPLKQLSNVKFFGFSFALLERTGPPFKPKSKHLEIIQDLKKTIEGNFIAKHDTA